MKHYLVLKAEDAILPLGKQGLKLSGGRGEKRGTIPLTKRAFVLSTLLNIRTLTCRVSGPNPGAVSRLCATGFRPARGVESRHPLGMKAHRRWTSGRGLAAESVKMR